MNVLITGTSMGIGRAIALKFLSWGHKVIGIDILESTIDDMNYVHIISDIRSKNLPDIKSIDILINNAGVQNSGEDIDINLNGTINITKKYGLQPNIKSILFMASASASSGAEFPEYAASKGGMVAYMKNVALEVAEKYKATSNSISAGGVTTELNKHILEDCRLWEQVKKETMLNKWATPEEIADLTYFLTVDNKSITGQDILIDNGEALKSNFIW